MWEYEQVIDDEQHCEEVIIRVFICLSRSEFLNVNQAGSVSFPERKHVPQNTELDEELQRHINLFKELTDDNPELVDHYSAVTASSLRPPF